MNHPPPVPQSAVPPLLYPAPRQAMSRGALIAVTAAISAALTSLFWLMVIGILALFVYDDPPDFQMVVDVPDQVALHQEFELKVQVSNPTDEELELGSVDLSDSLLDGFEIIRIDPQPEEITRILGLHSSYRAVTLSPGQEWTLVYHLKAVKQGVWTGDIDCCTPMEAFVTTSKTIVVE